MFPIVAIIAIHNKIASFEERDASSGWFGIEVAAWTLEDELNKEYSVLKSSLGESINAPPITGICGCRNYNIRIKIQKELLSLYIDLYPVQGSLCSYEDHNVLCRYTSFLSRKFLEGVAPKVILLYFPPLGTKFPLLLTREEGKEGGSQPGKIRNHVVYHEPTNLLILWNSKPS